MNKPHIICYMMTSLDGRIDCEMTSKLKGVEDYYSTLDKLNIPSVISGRVTALKELALNGTFSSSKYIQIDKEIVSKKVESYGYEVIVDTKGTLLWDDDSNYDRPHLILTSEKVSKEYLDYLDSKNISYIVTGKETIDLNRAVEIMYSTFNIKRLGVVGGSKINTSFLKENLLDEVVVLIGAGIDARRNYPTLFDGLDDSSSLYNLKLKDVKRFDSDAVLLSYDVIK